MIDVLSVVVALNVAAMVYNIVAGGRAMRHARECLDLAERYQRKVHRYESRFGDIDDPANQDTIVGMWNEDR